MVAPGIQGEPSGTSASRKLDTLSCLRAKALGQLPQWLQEHPPHSPHLQGLFQHVSSQCISDTDNSWCRITTQRTSPEGREKNSTVSILISGPFVGYSFKIDAVDEEEAQQIERDENLARLSNICHSLATIGESLASLSRTSQVVMQERARLSKDPGQIVQDHTRLLQEYNEMKDIGQQLIGFIAENRGVPIHTMYKDDEYGISAED